MSLYDSFTVAILPIDIVQADKSSNLQATETAIDALCGKGIDLIVLPELFSTGYIDDPAQAATLAEPTDGETMQAIKRLAAQSKATICGSYLSVSDGLLYNRGFMAEPAGEVTYYDKHHLFCISEESKICAAGSKEPPVIRYRGWNLALAICYDLRFPVWLRNKDNAYDALIIPANWPDRREYAWAHLLEARAIENVSYVIGANRSGKDAYGRYDGLSQIYDYMGKPIGKDCDGVVTAVLDREALRNFRKHFPVDRDADQFYVI